MEFITLDGSEFDELDFEDPFYVPVPEVEPKEPEIESKEPEVKPNEDNLVDFSQVDEEVFTKEVAPVTVYQTMTGFRIGDFDYTGEKALKIALGYSVQNCLMDYDTIETYTHWFGTQHVNGLMEDWISNTLDDPDSFIVFADNFTFDDDVNPFIGDEIQSQFKVEKQWVTLVDEDEYQFGEFIFSKDEIHSAIKNYFHKPGDAEQIAETLEMLDKANPHETTHLINYFFEWVTDMDEFSASIIGHILDERENTRMLLKQYASGSSSTFTNNNVNFVSQPKAKWGHQAKIMYERVGRDGYRINGYDYSAIFLLDKIIDYSDKHYLLDSLKRSSFKGVRDTEYIHEAIENWFEDYLDNASRFCDFLEIDEMAALYH